MHQRIGIRESFVTGDELKKMEPELNRDDIAGGAYEPDGGYADPALTASSFIEAAKRLGVEVMTRTPVQVIQVESGRIAGVETRRPSTRTSGSGDDPASSIPLARRKNMYGAGFVTRRRR